MAQLLRGPDEQRRHCRFRSEVIRHWRRHLCQRSQRHRFNWKRMTRLADGWLPSARIQHPRRIETFNPPIL